MGRDQADGSPLPSDGAEASLLLPMGRHGPAFLAYPNFDVYTQWNQSLVYASTAAYYATRLAGAPPMSRARQRRGAEPRPGEGAQQRLQQLGYDVGRVDGVLGAKTRAAIKAVQQARPAGRFLPDAGAARRPAPRRVNGAVRCRRAGAPDPQARWR